MASHSIRSSLSASLALLSRHFSCPRFYTESTNWFAQHVATGCLWVPPGPPAGVRNVSRRYFAIPNPAIANPARALRLQYLRPAELGLCAWGVRRLQIRMTLRHSIIWCLLYAGLAWVGPAALAGETRGTVCVAPIPRDSVWKGNDTGATLASTFTIQIDKLSAITVTTNLSGGFTNLALGQKHMVKIRMDGKPRESFPLRFETFERGAGDKVVHIRLRYDTMYGYWHPGRVDTLPCRCQKSPSNQSAAANRR
jgi:hypothetical protein